MKKSLVSALVAAALMASAATLATAMTPTKRIVDVLPKLDLEASIPEQFGDWTMDKRATGGVVNPQQTELLNQLYSQILSRTYYNAQGYRIMLSIAYGEDQRDANQVHYPEVCYPAQGFQLMANNKAEISTSLGVIPVKRLESQLSQQRYEPITYWTTVGSRAFNDGNQRKLTSLRYGFKGEIPDGMLFRISSIDRNSQAAFSIQEQFVKDLLLALPPEARTRITGL